MKIAIMTQPLGRNYGGIMQAWALQQVLKRMGHEVVTIDRQPDKRGVFYKVARIAYRGGLKTIDKRKAPINIDKHLPTIMQHTQAFIDQHITMSEPLYSTQQLREHFDRENYAAVIVGSDQTWRPKYSPNIYNLFLDFLENRTITRIVYASSFGVDEWEFTEEQTRRCAALAKKCDAISVREDSGVELCRQHLGVEATHVLDPTLLLYKEDYLQLIGAERLNQRQEGVYTYLLDKTPEKLALAKKAADNCGEQLFSCQANHSIGEDKIFDLNDLIMPDTRDWLAGFANARLVVTDSFHGVVFSIVFRRPFLVIVNDRRGSARFKSLLSAAGYENSVLSSQSPNVTVTADELPEPIDDLVKLQMLSKEYLWNALGVSIPNSLVARSASG